MRRRPWPLVILAVLHVLAPIPNFLLSAHLSGMPAMKYLHSFTGVWDALQYLLAFPITGLAIYFCKPWSFPVFIGAMSYGFYLTYQSYLGFPGQFPSIFLMGAYGLNLTVVSYFLIPNIRQVYFDKRLRWWESKPRFQVTIPALIRDSEGEAHCTITDVSEGGIFAVGYSRKVDIKQRVRVVFQFEYLYFSLDARVAHLGTKKAGGIGVQFIDLVSEEKKQLKNFIKALQLLNYETREPRLRIIEDFKAWSKTFLTTGKGLVPEIPDYLQKPLRRPNLIRIPIDRLGKKKTAPKKAA